MISDILLVLNSRSFIADGMYTLGNQRPVLPFDYTGLGLTGDDYMEGDYDENSYGFASLRLDYSSLCCTYAIKNNVL